MTTLEERIREFMAVTNWDVPKIAAVAGVSQSAVHQWIGGGSKEIKSIGNLKAALMLERASGFSALWLAQGEGPKMASDANSRLGHRAYSVTEVTPMPPPFRQDQFDALPEEQRRVLAEVTAMLVEAFSNQSPSSREQGAWKRRGAGQRQVTERRTTAKKKTG